MVKCNYQDKRLKKLLQLLKSRILPQLPHTKRLQLKQQLLRLETAYQQGTIDFANYKIQAPVLILAKRRSLTWVEQFLYSHATNLYTQKDIFTICQLINH